MASNPTTTLETLQPPKHFTIPANTSSPGETYNKENQHETNVWSASAGCDHDLTCFKECKDHKETKWPNFLENKSCTGCNTSLEEMGRSGFCVYHCEEAIKILENTLSAIMCFVQRLTMHAIRQCCENKSNLKTTAREKERITSILNYVGGPSHAARHTFERRATTIGQ